MESSERVIKLDLGFAPEAAVSGAVLVQTERSTFLTFNAMRPTDRMSPYGCPYTEDAGIAFVEFLRCSITKFGYPNDEAWSEIPLTRGLSYGFYEVINSSWKEERDRLNRYAFPEAKASNDRHFLFLFHDSSFECLAGEIKLEIVDRPYSKVFDRITARILSE